jgi:gamma-glutamyltranspeptidase/glutathione hydrolase
MRGAIAAGHPKTAEAGIEMLRLGGNIFDAIAASVLAACVAEPALTSLAGGGFLLAHTQDNRNILFDFFTQTPRHKRPVHEVDFYPVEVNFGPATQEFHVGLGSMAVPGTLGGIWHVHQRLGRLPFSVVVEPAIHYAREGVVVNGFQAYCLGILAPILLRSPAMQSVYAPNGHVLQAGEWLRIPDLANTLALVGQTGAQELYQGDLARQLIQDCQEQGGYLTLEDLQHYHVVERSPLMMQYRGIELVTNPPPSSGGTLIAFALALLSSLDWQTVHFGSETHVRSLADVMRLTNLARKDGYDARLYEPDIATRFLAQEHLDRYQQQFLWDQTPVNKWGSTTHISGIDGEGNAVSVTTSNGEGSGYVIPGTGVMVNNMLGEADLHPNGFHAWQPNVRISSMMAPTMVLNQHQPELVLGSGGSNRIRTAILQVISNIVDFGMTIDAAVHAPRLHWENGALNLEPGFEPVPTWDQTFPFDGVVTAWDAPNMFFGGVHAVMQNLDGSLDGAGDRRRGGAVAILD